MISLFVGEDSGGLDLEQPTNNVITKRADDKCNLWIDRLCHKMVIFLH
ncbi:hypothetical protein CCP3SC1_610020 [Gammaproteobacteria bacterium]